MYAKPVLERFGTFREVTQMPPPQGKKDPGADLASALNCESHAAPGSHAACGGSTGGATGGSTGRTS